MTQKFFNEKLLGWTFLFLGMTIIFYAGFSTLSVLGGKTTPPQVFNSTAPTFSLPGQSIGLPEDVKLPEGFSLNQKSDNKIKILDDDLYNKILNMSVNYLAMMFFASIGAKVAGIGVSLIKDIKVSIKEEKLGRP